MRDFDSRTFNWHSFSVALRRHWSSLSSAQVGVVARRIVSFGERLEQAETPPQVADLIVKALLTGLPGIEDDQDVPPAYIVEQILPPVLPAVMSQLLSDVPPDEQGGAGLEAFQLPTVTVERGRIMLEVTSELQRQLRGGVDPKPEEDLPGDAGEDLPGGEDPTDVPASVYLQGRRLVIEFGSQTASGIQQTQKPKPPAEEQYEEASTGDLAGEEDGEDVPRA